MNRRELLIGTVAFASAAALPAFAAQPTEMVVYVSELMDKAYEHQTTHGCKPWQSCDQVLVEWWLEARKKGLPLHLKIDNTRFTVHMKGVCGIGYTPGKRVMYIPDKVSALQLDGSYLVLKDRNQVLQTPKDYHMEIS